ncbi:MAG TPA: hypothetical protein VMW19_15125 [Myxococcota bacterium]|nr:hypothetical protein [Myxococcota bacterium]
MTKVCSNALVTLLVALAFGCWGGDEKKTSATTTPAAPASARAAAANPAAAPAPPGPANQAQHRTVDPEKLKERQAGVEVKQGQFPASFPEYLRYPDAQPKTSMLVNGSGLVMLTSDKPIADVLSHYREQLPSEGWIVDSVKESKDGGRASLRAHKQSENTTISISPGQGGGTDIAIALNLAG